MTRILIVDDELEKQRIFQIRLETLGYQVETASGGAEALEFLDQQTVDLVLLDINMPAMNGFDVLEKIRNNFKLRNLPVIMLTASTLDIDEVKAIELGADDFLTKDSRKEIIQVRIKNTLRKHHKIMGLNPLTQLPGNLQIDEEIEKRIHSVEKFSVAYFDLDHFKEFNDLFGFKAGDEAIQLTARLISDTVKQHGNETDFLGHVGGDDFILVSTPDKMKAICEYIIDKAGQVYPLLYPEKIRSRGYIIAKNRQGVQTRIELLSISIGVVSNEKRPVSSISEVASIASEVKKKAKSMAGNSYYMDTRRN